MNLSKHIAIAAVGLIASVAVACPLCKVAGGDLASESDATTQPSLDNPTTGNSRNNPLLPIRFGMAVDFTTAYFHHGYMQQDHGLITQPSITFSTQPIHVDQWKFEPYLSWWNSIHSGESKGFAGGHGNHTRVEQQYQEYLAAPHAGSPLPHYHTRLVDVIVFDEAGGGWFETEIMPGVLITNGPFKVDLQFKAGFYPTDFHDTKLELSTKFTYDAASLWDNSAVRPFSLNIGTAILHELKDDAGDEETVCEPFIEPLWRFTVNDHRIAFSTPVTLGVSPNGYYRDTNNNDQTVGYLSVGLKTTIALHTDDKYGKWFVNLGCTYNHMIADSAIFANGGEKDAIIGTIGFGVAF